MKIAFREHFNSFIHATLPYWSFTAGFVVAVVTCSRKLSHFHFEPAPESHTHDVTKKERSTSCPNAAAVAFD
jgi:hypothetical protein